MPEQIRISLSIDDGVKKLMDEGAQEYAYGNASAYVRGLLIFHALLDKKPTGRADIPGWLLDLYPLECIEAMREAHDRWDAEALHKARGAIHAGISEVERLTAQQKLRKKK